jgi:hypothetical protein
MAMAPEFLGSEGILPPTALATTAASTHHHSALFRFTPGTGQRPAPHTNNNGLSSRSDKASEERGMRGYRNHLPPSAEDQNPFAGGLHVWRLAAMVPPNSRPAALRSSAGAKRNVEFLFAFPNFIAMDADIVWWRSALPVTFIKIE